ncbi:MAG TPA: hypothetical protein VHX44_04140, partial [Planctomycetota bacterium]|nr:hypothetical protein [Planctomycetota bacterium]
FVQTQFKVARFALATGNKGSRCAPDQVRRVRWNPGIITGQGNTAALRIMSERDHIMQRDGLEDGLQAMETIRPATEHLQVQIQLGVRPDAQRLHDGRGSWGLASARNASSEPDESDARHSSVITAAADYNRDVVHSSRRRRSIPHTPMVRHTPPPTQCPVPLLILQCIRKMRVR